MLPERSRSQLSMAMQLFPKLTKNASAQHILSQALLTSDKTSRRRYIILLGGVRILLHITRPTPASITFGIWLWLRLLAPCLSARGFLCAVQAWKGGFGGGRGEGGGFEGQFAGREYFHIVKIPPPILLAALPDLGFR